MAAVALSAHFLVPVHSRITKTGQEPQCGPILTQCGPERPDVLSQSGPGKPMFLVPAIYVLGPLHLACFSARLGLLPQDEAAVGAALTMPWSSGQAEGQINKLKLIKRQMYGRASFNLLRRRVLLAA